MHPRGGIPQKATSTIDSTPDAIDKCLSGYAISGKTLEWKTFNSRLMSLLKMTLRIALTLCISVSTPIAGIAAGNSTIDRTQVVAELRQLEQMGYTPSENDPAYPANMEAAQRRVQLAAASKANDSVDSAIGGAPFVSQASGRGK
ncbi:DUF4148 domain-containing protein [Caballeronia sp. ATUFL_M1_KS5A]|uniref:DUF4148 domain-containing protein n=1 Tax=Caballeronia sp. ATUFL_M1_KS5A TaxID=2921778 RepID=UPI0020281F43|nr:DUF4148 domain-containing protein [Caballeronia sp. ATUFL_M1_KS5A]